MPPKKPPGPPPNVARLSTEDQISYLFHQYEGFADWRIAVDEKLKKVDALDAKVETLMQDFHQIRTEQRETGLGVREILLFLKGQQIPGLERPGLSDDIRQLQADRKQDRAELDDLKTWKNRALWTFGGMCTAVGAGVFLWGDTFKQLLSLLK